MKNIRIALKPRNIEEIYEIGENDGYCDIIQQFVDHYDITSEESEEMTVTEVGGFYDQNR